VNKIQLYTTLCELTFLILGTDIAEIALTDFDTSSLVVTCSFLKRMHGVSDFLQLALLLLVFFMLRCLAILVDIKAMAFKNCGIYSQ